MSAPYPQEFRDDVVRVARNREAGQKLSQITKDFGISESCLTNWMRQADVEAGARPGTTREESSELRETATPRATCTAGRWCLRINAGTWHMDLVGRWRACGGNTWRCRSWPSGDSHTVYQQLRGCRAERRSPRLAGSLSF